MLRSLVGSEMCIRDSRGTAVAVTYGMLPLTRQPSAERAAAVEATVLIQITAFCDHFCIMDHDLTANTWFVKSFRLRHPTRSVRVTAAFLCWPGYALAGIRSLPWIRLPPRVTATCRPCQKSSCFIGVAAPVAGRRGIRHKYSALCAQPSSPDRLHVSRLSVSAGAQAKSYNV